ncbi:phosphotransferase [Chitinophaga sp. sic0106]|uniref:phosphotransferase n=1 Tax=Chitinophaga sp. sic0106 TaxID=2854785 RepID=UPI001C457A14|nr:phosphotransferase [Chitinophaga sp. sic0106]MBV7529689.1 phosphotransferase [Chitinophaga sp. sic0106]
MSLNNTIFPADRLADVNEAFAAAFGGAVISEAQLLAGGLSAASVYKVIANDRPYVMKLDKPGNNTYERIALAAKAGIAPPLLYSNARAGIIISEFVENKPIRSIYSGVALAEKLAVAVKQTHGIAYTVPGDDMKATVDHIVEGFRRSNIISGPVPDECMAKYAELKKVYPWADTDKVFSHNDLNPSNILCDGTAIWIIDWDTAFLNDRYVDLAGVANFFIHSPEQETAFLKTYFGEVSTYQSARFYVMRQISRMIYSLMMLQLAAGNKPGTVDQEMEGIFLQDVGPLIGSGKLSLATHEGQLMYGKALMNEAVAQMRSGRFEEALGRLGS